jgi:membrane associated rhomboid family serine protease
VYQRPGSYYRGGGMGMPITPMVRNLIAINVVVWLLQDRFLIYSDVFSLSVPGVFQENRFWQPFTYMWLHGSGFLHIFFNMLSLWMFGPQLEAVWGSQRFLRFYLTCGIGAGIFILLGNSLMQVPYPTLGASGAIFGVLTAFSLLWPDRTILLLFPPIPLRALYFIPFLFLMTLALPGGGNISHVGHLGGAVTGAFIMREEL